MLTVVLTGGIGSGKTTAAEYFRDRGATVIALDDVARGVVEPGTIAHAAIAAEFGPGVMAPDGRVDRAALAAAAFADPGRAARLNEIVHPAVAREVGPALRELDLLPMKPEVVVLEVPLLVEAPVYRELADQVLAIEAPVSLRIERAIAKGMREDDVRARIACQATDDERAELADDVIVNDGSREMFLAKLETYWNERVDRGGATRP